jgi:hypothetical protein
VTPMRFQLLSATMPKESKRRILQHLDSPHEKSAKRREHISTLVKIPFGVFRNPFVGDDTVRSSTGLFRTWIPRSWHDGHGIVRPVAQWMRGPKTPVSSWVPRAHGCGQDDAGREGHRQGAGACINARPWRRGRRLYATRAQLRTSRSTVTLWGLNAAQCMNPVLFDELDKVSESPRGGSRTVSYISPTAPRITGFGTDTSVTLIWTCPGGHDLLVQRSRQVAPPPGPYERRQDGRLQQG